MNGTFPTTGCRKKCRTDLAGLRILLAFIASTASCGLCGLLLQASSRSVVCLCVCVCLYVGHTGEPCKNSRTDRDAVWGTQTCMGLRNRVLGGMHIDLVNTIEWYVCGDNVVFCQISLTTCFFPVVLLLCYFVNCTI